MSSSKTDEILISLNERTIRLEEKIDMIIQHINKRDNIARQAENTIKNISSIFEGDNLDTFVSSYLGETSSRPAIKATPFDDE